MSKIPTWVWVLAAAGAGYALYAYLKSRQALAQGEADQAARTAAPSALAPVAVMAGNAVTAPTLAQTIAPVTFTPSGNPAILPGTLDMSAIDQYMASGSNWLPMQGLPGAMGDYVSRSHLLRGYRA